MLAETLQEPASKVLRVVAASPHPLPSLFLYVTLETGPAALFFSLRKVSRVFWPMEVICLKPYKKATLWNPGNLLSKTGPPAKHLSSRLHLGGVDHLSIAWSEQTLWGNKSRPHGPQAVGGEASRSPHHSVLPCSSTLGGHRMPGSPLGSLVRPWAFISRSCLCT